MWPTVSIIMPTFNRLAYCRTAIHSVFNQSFPAWELIVADDGSGAETQVYLDTLERTPRVKVLRLLHTGNPPAVRNVALRAASGEFVAFLDSDDWWERDKLAVQLRALLAPPHRGWSYTGFTMAGGDGRPLTGRGAKSCRPFQGRILDALLEDEATVVQSSVVVRRDLILALGGYDPAFPVCGDYHLWIRLAAHCDAGFIDAPLVHVRRHDQHYADDLTALKDLSLMLEAVRRAALAPHLERTLGARRARAEAGIARAHALRGDRAALVRALASSAPSCWRHRDWWHGAAAACLRAGAPRRLVQAVREWRIHRSPGRAPPPRRP